VDSVRLTRALELNRKAVVSLVGAGGKTTAMFRLAEELASEGWRVVTTTTTMIRREGRCGHTILEPERDVLLEKARHALADLGRVTVASGFSESEGKLIGIDPSLVDALIALAEVDAVIVEADGAKGRSLKAPAPYEPVIPTITSLLLPVAAADAVGRPLDERFVHRPEIVARVTGAGLGQIIAPELMAAVLLHPEGGLKNAPPAATVMPLINKVSYARLESARQIAEALLRSSGVQRVLLCAVAQQNPIKEAWGRVGAVVLAAGGSRRFGSPKQLLPWKGRSLLEHVVDTVLGSSVDQVVVVLGHERESIGALVRDKGVVTVINEDWKRGQAGSVRVGLQAVRESCDACLFVLADQPHVTPELIDSILARYRRTLAPVVTPVYRGRRGNPVLFARTLFPELLALQGDQGGRQVMERHENEVETVEVRDPTLFLDIDTVDDYEDAS
jgi:molybdenum cofactor cytidylyltransferase